MTVHTEYIGGATITLAIDGVEPASPHKSVIAFSIRLPYVPGSESASESGRVFFDNDLSVLTRESDTETLREAYRALCSFLDAAAESYGHAMRNRTDLADTENGDLFPADIVEWAYVNSDELSMASIDEETIRDLTYQGLDDDDTSCWDGVVTQVGEQSGWVE